MSQAIIRVCESSPDAELCIKKGEDIIFKNLSIDKVLRIFKHYNHNGNRKITLLDKQIIALGDDYAVIKQPEHRKIVTLENKSYMINFPNAIYVMSFDGDKIDYIKAYAYEKYKGEKTELFEYPMPNELSGNKICLGTADRKIENEDYISALEKIIATPYTHYTFTGIKGFSQSIKWFEYLEKNKVPYKLMRALNIKLKDIVV